MSVFKFDVLKDGIGFLWFANANTGVMASTAYIASMCQSSVVNTRSQNATTKFGSRVLLKRNWKQDYTAAAAAPRICEVEGEGVSERVAQRWFQHFNTGEENTKDLPCSGRPK